MAPSTEDQRSQIRPIGEPGSDAFAGAPHRRFNPLTGEWVLVSPHRNARPWLGTVEATRDDVPPTYDAKCHLCPGNTRAGGIVNPAYDGPFVFTNDFPALLPDTPVDRHDGHPVFRAETARGTARVICFSPRHDLNLPQLPVATLRRIVDTWAEQVGELGREFEWVAIFENKGAMMGCSNPHPHSQVWATDYVPNIVRREDEWQRRYLEETGKVLLTDTLDAEIAGGTRIVLENDSWVVVVPYWAVWPYETLVLPRRNVLRLPELDAGERDGLAEILKRLTTRYDNLFKVSFPYTMGWHGAPNRDGDFAHWRLHAHFYPPLLRSATIRKFMVGFEMLAEAQRDMTAEQAAESLRALPDTHYLSGTDTP